MAMVSITGNADIEQAIVQALRRLPLDDLLTGKREAAFGRRLTMEHT